VALPDQLPEPPDDFETHSASTERPSWLVGAEEGAASEIEGLERGEMKLTRPTLSAVPRPAGAPPGAPPATPAAPPRAVAWTAAGNSIPRLTQVPEPARRAPEPPVDDLDPVADPLSDPEPPEGAFAVASTRPTFTRTLEEPWWLVLGERIGSDRRIQVAIGAVVALGLAFLLWPRGGNGVSLRELRRHPERWEGQSVSVNGRVGEVFPLGSGFVFNLHQGRDTIVVFTRSRQPAERAHVQVTGEVSAGYLDGRARLAILEAPPTAPHTP